MNDKDLETLYSEYLMFTDQMVSTHGAMEVAAVMMAQALSIYKTSMSEADFNNIVDKISESRSKVQTFNPVVLQ